MTTGSDIRAPGDGHTPQEPWYLATTPLETRPWLVRMRWATAALEVLLLAATFALPTLDLPLDHIAWLVAADAAANAVIATSLSGTHATSRVVIAGALAVQAVLITALLELTGGPSNPFVVVYGLQVAVAALTLGSAAATGLAFLVSAGYGVLIYWHAHELVPTHHRLNDFPIHLLTIWLAGTVTADIVAHFVGRASEALQRREEALEAMRQRAARTERVMALTTLAAGAAHELSTPLATIAVAAHELTRELEQRRADAALTDDARLIRSEVDRCQTILDQMSGRAGGSAADDVEPVELAALIDDVRARLAPGAAQRLVVRVSPNLAPLFAPRAGLSQTLLSLVSNAIDASDEDQSPVLIDVVSRTDAVSVSVVDQGPGFSADAQRHAGEPFYTTKEPGRGLGLGLFLARAFAERVGGSLTIQSGPGTTATLELPIKPV